MIRKSGYRFSEEIMLKQKGETAHAVWRCGNVMIVPLTGTQFRLHKSGRPALEKSTGAGGGFDLEDIFTRRPLTLSAAFSFSRHCEPPGRANARPMTGSAKQSISPRKERIDCVAARTPRNDVDSAAPWDRTPRRHSRISRAWAASLMVIDTSAIVAITLNELDSSIARWRVKENPPYRHVTRSAAR